MPPRNPLEKEDKHTNPVQIKGTRKSSLKWALGFKLRQFGKHVNFVQSGKLFLHFLVRIGLFDIVFYCWQKNTIQQHRNIWPYVILSTGRIKYVSSNCFRYMWVPLSRIVWENRKKLESTVFFAWINIGRIESSQPDKQPLRGEYGPI